MTKEEAIETIKMAVAHVEWEFPMDYAVAFDMTNWFCADGERRDG